MADRVYLTDVATVTDTYKDLSSISRLNGEPCLSIQVKKRSGVNTVAMIRDIKQLLDRFQLPPGIKLTIIMDQSEFIADMIKELENNIFSGFVLVGGGHPAFHGLAQRALRRHGHPPFHAVVFSPS
jgi:multidrug efflux pump subunit AcrB